MIFQNLIFHLGQSGFYRLHLMQYVHAIAVVGDHLSDTADLSFDPDSGTNTVIAATSLLSADNIRRLWVDHRARRTGGRDDDVGMGQLVAQGVECVYPQSELHEKHVPTRYCLLDVIDQTDRVINILNAPSPAATASLNIGAMIVDRVDLRKDPMALQRLQEACEKAKKELSSAQSSLSRHRRR